MVAGAVLRPESKGGKLWFALVSSDSPMLLGLDYLKAARANVTHDRHVEIDDGRLEPCDSTHLIEDRKNPPVSHCQSLHLKQLSGTANTQAPTPTNTLPFESQEAGAPTQEPCTSDVSRRRLGGASTTTDGADKLG